MRYNGLCMVIDMAAAELGSPLVDRYRRAILLGAIREDYWYLPLVGPVESLSLEHFYGPGLPGGFIPFLTPGTRAVAPHLFEKGLAEARAGRVTSAFVQLGRCSHLLTDMACPVHVHRVAHFTDPYEWYVEANRDALSTEPVPPRPQAASVVELIEGLAGFTQQFAADGTNSLHGRLMKKIGWRRSLGRDVVAGQARAIIPMAASYNAALFALFLQKSGLDAPATAGATSAAPP
jgi:hypothetical protein